MTITLPVGDLEQVMWGGIGFQTQHGCSPSGEATGMMGNWNQVPCVKPANRKVHMGWGWGWGALGLHHQ